MGKQLTDFFDQESDYQDSKEMTAMLVLTQVVGVGLIIVGLALLKSLPHASDLILASGVVGGVFLILWFSYCWYDEMVNPIATFTDFFEPLVPIPETKRKTRVLRATLVLIVADTVLLAILIAITGGSSHSPLDPLLPVIPIIAIILRQPKRTVFVALGLGFSVLSIFLIHWATHEIPLYHPHWWTLPLFYDAHTDVDYPMSFTVVAIGAIGLSVVEYRIVHRKPPLTKGIDSTIRPLVAHDHDLRGIEASIKRGTRTWVTWLEHRDLPVKDLSLVHTEQDVHKQSVVLSMPYWVDGRSSWWDRVRRRKRITRHITFLTLAAHWIDDHFDALGEYCKDQSIRENILRSSPEDILATHYPRLEELLKRMEKAAHKEHKQQVRKAVIRIIYGGLIQNAQSADRLEFLLKAYVNFVAQDLTGDLKATYMEFLDSKRPLTLVLTSKVVMELLDCCSPQFSAQESEFFNLLYCPILYHHDCDNEVAKETYGRAFGESAVEVKGRLPSDSDLVQLINRCQSLSTGIFGQTGLPAGRKRQLKLLLYLYDKKIPSAIQEAYNQFL